MKTIKQVADELGVSKDKVKYRVRKLPTTMVKREGDVTLITNDGVLLLKGLLEGKKITQQEYFPGEFTRQYVERLQLELDIKNRQIENQSAQISDLTTALVAAQQTAAAAQALHAATVKQNLEDKEQKAQEKEYGIFSRFFGKRSD